MLSIRVGISSPKWLESQKTVRIAAALITRHIRYRCYSSTCKCFYFCCVILTTNHHCQLFHCCTSPLQAIASDLKQMLMRSILRPRRDEHLFSPAWKTQNKRTLIGNVYMNCSAKLPALFRSLTSFLFSLIPPLFLLHLFLHFTLFSCLPVHPSTALVSLCRSVRCLSGCCCSSVCGSSASSSNGPAHPTDPFDRLCGQNAGEQ